MFLWIVKPTVGIVVPGGEAQNTWDNILRREPAVCYFSGWLAAIAGCCGHFVRQNIGVWPGKEAPWVSASPNETLGEPHFLQLLCAAFSSRAHLADYYVMIMGALWHQARAFSQ